MLFSRRKIILHIFFVVEEKKYFFQGRKAAILVPRLLITKEKNLDPRDQFISHVNTKRILSFAKKLLTFH